MKTRKIPDSTVRRLSLYLRLLREPSPDSGSMVSSRELAERSGTSSAQVRKDLSLFGSFGKRGSGYSARALETALEGILGLQRRWRVALVGVGKIGSALLGYADLEARGFDVVAAFDSNPRKVGREVFGTTVYAVRDLPHVVAREAVSIGIIATPPESAQETADRLVGAGVSGILNFAPTKLDVTPSVAVRTMDVVLEMESLSFDLTAAGRRGERPA